MSIFSMTGYGKGEATDDDYTLTVELKSVNHRFREVRFRMSSFFASLELPLRKKIENEFNRGTIDVFINYKKAENNNDFNELDEEKIKAYLKSINKIVEPTGVELEARPVDFLRNEFYKERGEDQLEQMAKLINTALDGAIDQMKKYREQEGEKLLKVIESHLKQYEDFYSAIPKLEKDNESAIKEKINKKLDEIRDKVTIDEQRFHQEVVYYLEKLDIHEEINRIDAHLSKLKSVVQTAGDKGRQIDFLIQELNRETNTIGSKTVLTEISENVVQMKVQLEKIREQALNIE